MCPLLWVHYNVTDMSDMFMDCSSLTSLNVSGFDTSRVTRMISMFRGCSSLTSLDIRGLDTRLVTNMWCMFDGCSSLTSLDVRGFDMSQVTDMTGLFSNCSGLTSLDISRFNTSRVTRMISMFRGCSSLTSLDESIKGKATVLIFTTTWCTNGTSTIGQLGNANWYPCPNVNVVVGMLGADKQATTEFHNTYDFEGMRFCYTESIKIARLKCHQVRRKHIRDFLREKDRKRL